MILGMAKNYFLLFKEYERLERRNERMLRFERVKYCKYITTYKAMI